MGVMKRYYVYVLIRPDTEQVFYVGKGQGNRVHEHKADAFIRGVRSHKCNIIRKHGVRHEFVEYFECEADAYKKEREMIALYGLANLTNQTPGGEGGGMHGKTLSAESRKKISATMTGVKHSPERVEKIRQSRLGKPLSEEHRQKLMGRRAWNKGLPMHENAKRAIAKANIGSKHGPMSEERKKKIGSANSGKPRTDEWKQKIATALRGIPFSEERKAALRGRTPANKGQTGVFKHSEEAKAKIGAASAARARSDETRRRQSIGIKRAFALKRAQQTGVQQ